MSPASLLLLSLACVPGQVFPVRRPVLRLDLPCGEDSASGCTDLWLLDVPYGRQEELEFMVWNDGSLALTVSNAISAPPFWVLPAGGVVPEGDSLAITVGYAPTGFEDREATLTITHDALGAPVDVSLHGSTDPDADDDGYRTDSAPGGDDCNDFNASVNPGVLETWYDGIDQDCDGGSDYDQDRDGHDIHTRPDGDDCDDLDPLSYPGAPDPAGDGVDQDCDGEDG